MNNNFIFKKFSQIEAKYSQSIRIHEIDPLNAQIGFGVADKYWKNQPYEGGCKVHKLLFRSKKIISSYCFDCIKIEIHPQTVLDFFKLMFMFDSLDLKDNNHRKLWLRPRKELEVNYSGTLYFRSIAEAKKSAQKLNEIIKKEINTNIPLIVKRGCSEFNNLINNYHDINESYNSLVNDKKTWEKIEFEFKKSDEPGLIKPRPWSVYPEIENFTEYHLNIMYSWLAFAKLIGDDSYLKVTSRDWNFLSHSLSRSYQAYFLNKPINNFAIF